MEYLSLDAASAALSLSRTQVRRLLAAGTLVGTRHGGNRRGVWLIEAASVEAEQRRRKDMDECGVHVAGYKVLELD
jgi:hypothetical protein